MVCPDTIETEDQLDEFLTRPGAPLVEFVKTIAGPLLILGAGGKMGPTLAVLAQRAASAAGKPLDVIAVSRFTDSKARKWLEDRNVKTTSCDLLQRSAIEKLPEAPSIIYLVGLKFGTAQNPGATWAMNTILPALVAERYPKSRIVALSTGNVYPFSDVKRGGSTEMDPLTPLGEYANAAVARERIFQFFSVNQQTPVALLRLFYAVELRYGVLVDIAQHVYHGSPIELTNGYFNCIWQGDANEMILRSLALVSSPPSVWNLCRPEVFSVRDVAARLGELFGRPPRFTGSEAPNALLGNSRPLCDRLGMPTVPLTTMLCWIANWIKQGGRDLNRPTHFEVRDGNY
ncbi:MAG: NAD(P)-dependent oxidoreductase [Verrucomicrobia subdivision 3 bacterium]|nr:NAD(P)-dependent oxidoreductase [Limisphaerales bacterium]